MLKFLLFIPLLFNTGCFTTTQFIDPYEVVVPTVGDRSNVVDALKNAASIRGWTIEPSGEAFLGTLNTRGHRVVVKFDVTAHSIAANYVSSENMHYDHVRIHRKYYKWLDKLFNETKRELIKMKAKADA